MSLISTFLSVHNVEDIQASRLGHGLGTTLVLTMGGVNLSICFRVSDAGQVDRLVGAINGAQGPIYNPPHNHDEAAAYTAQTTLFGDER